MESDQVLISRENDWVFCDTRMVSKKFNVHHINIKRIVESIKDKIMVMNDIKQNTMKSFPMIRYQEYVYRGRLFSYYELNKSAFILIIMKLETDNAFEWQIKFIEAFERMEEQILSEHERKQDALWKTQREQGKLVRLTAMDTVKEFVDYATNQGSENAKFYYKHITTACYKCLQLIQTKKPSLRDTLDTLELNQLMLAEVVAERSIKEHMANNEHYKTIFVLVKQDLERFADSLKIKPRDKNESIYLDVENKSIVKKNKKIK